MSTVFEVNGKNYVFNFGAFKRLYKLNRKESKLSNAEYEEKLADLAGVSSSSIHAYLYASNGPGDLSIITAISDYWEIDITYLLLEEIVQKTNRLNDREKEAVRRIYVAICDFMNNFIMSDGIFMNRPDGTWLGRERQGEYIQYCFNQVELAYDKEYIDLANHSIYDELAVYIDKDLSEMYEEKCDGSIRYEPEEEGGRSAHKDYVIAREKLIRILDKYL